MAQPGKARKEPTGDGQQAKKNSSKNLQRQQVQQGENTPQKTLDRIRAGKFKYRPCNSSHTFAPLTM